MATDYSISNLRTKLGTLARPNNFKVSLSLASTGVSGADVDIMPALSSISGTFEFRCEKAELPGRTVATTDDTMSGTTLKLPYDMTYNDIQLSIICSTDMLERKFFEQWMDFIVKPGKLGRGNAGTIAYYSDYAKGNKLKVSQLNDSGTSILAYTCHDVYPIALTPMNATWEENNTYQRFGVTLCYRYHLWSTT
jgi:hypothetical protein